MAVAAAATLGLGAAPATAHADPLGANALLLPWTDAAKAMCLGVQLKPVWGNRGNYTGRCRYGMPLETLRSAIYTMDRGREVGTAREYGLSQGHASSLSTEITNIAGLPVLAGRKRVKRDAKKGKKSWGARSAVLCALGGAMAAGPPLIYDLIVHGEGNPDDIAKNGAVGCATGVTAPPLYRWAKNHGFDLEE